MIDRFHSDLDDGLGVEFEGFKDVEFLPLCGLEICDGRGFDNGLVDPLNQDPATGGNAVHLQQQQ